MLISFSFVKEWTQQINLLKQHLKPTFFLCDTHIFQYKTQLSLPETAHVAARNIQNRMFSMPIPPVPAPLWIKFPHWTCSVRSAEHTRHPPAATASGLWAGFQSGLHPCSNPSAHSSDPQPMRLRCPRTLCHFFFLPPTSLCSLPSLCPV